MSNILQACFDTLNADNQPAAPKETDIIRVCEILKQYIFDFVIAGGYPRDVYYGVTPKDCDIIVYNFHESDFAESSLFGLMLSQLQSEFSVVQSFSRYEGQEDDRIAMVIKLPDQLIDIVFYNNADSPQQAIRQFDCNLNQFLIPSSVPAWDYAKGPRSIDLSDVRHLNLQAPKDLVFLKELPPQRICYMARKFEELTGRPVTGEAVALLSVARLDIEQSCTF